MRKSASVVLGGVMVAVIGLSACASAPSMDRAVAAAVDPGLSVKFIPGNNYASTAAELLSASAVTKSVDVIALELSDTFKLPFSGEPATDLPAQLVALKNAHAHDADFSLHVYAEDRNASSKKLNADALAALTGAGFADSPKQSAPFAFYRMNGVSDGTSTGVTHTKLVMVDGHKILAGSTNWTATSITKNNETDLLVDSRYFGEHLKAYIEAIQEDPGKLWSQVFTQGNVTLYTDGAYLKAILAFLGSVRSGDSLSCSMYLFNYDDPLAKSPAPANEIEKALVSAAQNAGAEKLQLMLETSNANPPISKTVNEGNPRAVKALQAAGITNIFWDSPTTISHMKFCVIARKDGGYTELLGSSNWNYEDIELNHQLNWKVEDSEGLIGPPLLRYLKAALANGSPVAD